MELYSFHNILLMAVLYTKLNYLHIQNTQDCAEICASCFIFQCICTYAYADLLGTTTTAHYFENSLLQHKETMY